MSEEEQKMARVQAAHKLEEAVRPKPLQINLEGLLAALDEAESAGVQAAVVKAAHAKFVKAQKQQDRRAAAVAALEVASIASHSIA